MFWITSAAWRFSVTASSIVALAPAAKIDANVTSVTPIISAAAVAAVRPGWRIAFSRASRPGKPAKRCAGRPSDRRQRPHQARAEQRDAR